MVRPSNPFDCRDPHKWYCFFAPGQELVFHSDGGKFFYAADIFSFFDCGSQAMALGVLLRVSTIR
jgi:hypothetical protein